MAQSAHLPARAAANLASCCATVAALATQPCHPVAGIGHSAGSWLSPLSLRLPHPGRGGDGSNCLCFLFFLNSWRIHLFTKSPWGWRFLLLLDFLPQQLKTESFQRTEQVGDQEGLQRPGLSTSRKVGAAGQRGGTLWLCRLCTGCGPPGGWSSWGKWAKVLGIYFLFISSGSPTWVQGARY